MTDQTAQESLEYAYQKLHSELSKELLSIAPYNKKDLMEIKSVLKDLIAEKIRVYPEFRVQIFNAQLTEDGGKAYVAVASANIRYDTIF